MSLREPAGHMIVTDHVGGNAGAILTQGSAGIPNAEKSSIPTPCSNNEAGAIVNKYLENVQR